MAVPKKKKSKSRRNMRRGSNGSYRVQFANIVTDPETGDYSLAHNISPEGFYKGRKILSTGKNSTSNGEANTEE